MIFHCARPTRGVRDRALREDRRSSGSIPSSILGAGDGLVIGLRGLSHSSRVACQGVESCIQYSIDFIAGGGHVRQAEHHDG
jgi:hypothetical protein